MSTRFRSSLLAALALGAVALPARAEDNESLQATLARLRKERSALAARLKTDLVPILARIETLFTEQRKREAAQVHEELVALGPDVAPLLIPSIDPGADADDARAFRAEQVAEALADLGSPAVTDALLALLESGSKAGKRNALVALSGSSDVERVSPPLAEFFRTTMDAELKPAALEAVTKLGGPTANALIGDALLTDETAVISVALDAIVRDKNAACAPHVLAFIEGTQARSHVPAILDYYVAVDEMRSEENLLALVGLANRSTTYSASKVRILETMLRFDLDKDRQLKKAIEPLATIGSEEVRTAALTLLARNGDKGARRDLLKPFDNRINRQKDFAKAYIERADVYYKIGDYRRAIRDYEEANDLNGERNRKLEPYIGLARCFALSGKFKEAADALDKAPISIQQLHELADDPDFAEFRASRYVSAFHLGTDD